MTMPSSPESPSTRQLPAARFGSVAEPLEPPERPLPHAVSNASSAAWSAPLEQRPASGSSTEQSRSSQADRIAELGIPSLALADVGYRRNPDHASDHGETFAAALKKLTQVLYKSADWMNSSRSNSTAASGSDYDFMRKGVNEGSELGDEALSQQDARRAMDDAVEHVFGNEAAIEACELYFDAPYDRTDLSQFRQEIQTELAHVGFPDDHLSTINIDLEPGSIVARLIGPEPSIDILAKLPLRGMRVLGYPACFSRDEFDLGMKAFGMDMCGMAEDAPFCHSKGGSTRSTPVSQASSLRRMRIVRPQPPELEVLADELRSSRSSLSSASRRSDVSEPATCTHSGRPESSGSFRSSEDSSILDVLQPSSSRSCSGLPCRPMEYEMQQLDDEVDICHGEQDGYMDRQRLDNSALPDDTARRLSGTHRHNASGWNDMAYLESSTFAAGCSRNQGWVRSDLHQSNDMFDEALRSSCGFHSPALHTARSSIPSGSSPSSTGQDFNFDAHQMAMELGYAALSRDAL